MMNSSSLIISHVNAEQDKPKNSILEETDFSPFAFMMSPSLVSVPSFDDSNDLLPSDS